MNQRIVLSLCSCFFSFIGFCKSKVTRKFFNCFLNPLLSTQCWLSQDTSCLPCTPAFSWVSFPETALLHLRWDIPLTSRASQAALGGERSTHFDAGQSGRCLKPPGAPVVWISLAGPEFRGPWSPQGWLMALRAARPLSTPSSSLRAGLSGWSHGLRGPVLRTCCGTTAGPSALCLSASDSSPPCATCLFLCSSQLHQPYLHLSLYSFWLPTFLCLWTQLSAKTGKHLKIKYR